MSKDGESAVLELKSEDRDLEKAFGKSWCVSKGYLNVLVMGLAFHLIILAFLCTQVWILDP